MKNHVRFELELGKRQKRDDLTNEVLLPYLTDYLGINEIHWYKNLSPSQTIEKLDLAYGRAMRFERLNAETDELGWLNLQVVINIGINC